MPWKEKEQHMLERETESKYRHFDGQEQLGKSVSLFSSTTQIDSLSELLELKPQAGLFDISPLHELAHKQGESSAFWKT